MYYVYCGYSNSDHYDSSVEPTHKIKELETKQDVLNFYNEFLGDHCGDYPERAIEDNMIFRVFCGKEVEIEQLIKLYKELDQIWR